MQVKITMDKLHQLYLCNFLDSYFCFSVSMVRNPVSLEILLLAWQSLKKKVCKEAVGS